MAEPIRDQEEFVQGQHCQNEGKAAFHTGYYEEAYYLYKQAEEHYRKAHKWPETRAITRVFFMQQSALRCLEELLDSGRLDLYDTYKNEAEAFFSEWPIEDIHTKIDSFRVCEALEFRQWRKSYHTECSEFYIVNACVEQGNFQKARDFLDSRLAIWQASPSLYGDSDGLCAIARSKKEIITVKELSKKPERSRNISDIAAAYERAADASQLPEGSTSSQRQRIEAFRHWYLSNAFKFRAFACLEDEAMADDPVRSLADAKGFFTKGIESANKAIAGSHKNFPDSHVFYLRFWQSIVSERCYLLEFMKTGEETVFQSCLQAWRRLSDLAKTFCQQAGEDTIFPNRFYCLKDVELEEYFLNAAYAFRHKNWADCRDLLEKWQEQFPLEYLWSWRHIQVYMRLCLVKAFLAFLSGDQDSLCQLTKELTGKVGAEPIGKVGRYLLNEVRSLPMKVVLDEGYLNSLCPYFPLDSYADTYQIRADIDPFMSLPLKVYQWLNQTRLPSTEVEVQAFKPKLLGCLEAMLGYICDYHLQVVNVTKSLPAGDLETLIQMIPGLVKAQVDQKSHQFLQVRLEDLKIAVSRLGDVKEPAEYESHSDKIRGIIKGMCQFAPVLIDIKSPLSGAEDDLWIEGFPDWALLYSEPPRLERNKILIRCRSNQSFDPGMYYLPPAWRKGTCTSYHVSERHPLHPVRFRPTWWLWEAKASEIAPNVLKKSLILVLGSYTSPALLDELQQVCNTLCQKGYYARLLRDLPGTDEMSLEDKVKAWGLMSRFCVMVDRVAGGQLAEYGYLKSQDTIMAHLRPKGESSSRMIGHSEAVGHKSIKMFEFDESSLTLIDAVVEWAEEFIKRRTEELREYYK